MIVLISKVFDQNQFFNEIYATTFFLLELIIRRLR